MGTAAKIIGVEPGDMAKINNVAIGGISKLADQTVETSYDNTYSIDCDGSDGYILCGNDATLSNDTFTVAFWIRPASLNAWDTIIAKDGYTANDGWIIRVEGTDIVFQRSQTAASCKFAKSLITLDTWNHITVSYDSSSTTAKIYLNGGTPVTDPSFGPIVKNATINLLLGARNENDGTLPGLNFFDGNIDETGYWNSVLTDAQIQDEVYSSSGATDLANLATAGAPVAWWRMGDNSPAYAAEWLIPHNANKDRWSNYSMLTPDAASTYWSLPDVSLFKPAGLDFSISMWVKHNDIAGRKGYFSNPGDTSPANTGFILWTYDNLPGRPQLYIGSGSGWATMQIDIGDVMASDTWYHLFASYDAATTTGKIGINGVIVKTDSNMGTMSVSGLDSPRIGSYSSYLARDCFMTEIAFWESDVSSEVAAIYGSGTAPNLMDTVGVTDPDAYYRAEVASLSGSTWTMTDQSANSNDATSVGIWSLYNREGEGADTGTAVINNASTVNVAEAERVSVTPP